MEAHVKNDLAFHLLNSEKVKSHVLMGQRKEETTVVLSRGRIKSEETGTQFTAQLFTFSSFINYPLTWFG